MNVQVLKLTTGENIIGDVSEVEEVYEVKHSLSVTLSINEEKQGSFKLGMIPWAPYASSGVVPIFKSQVLAVITPDDMLTAEFTKRSEFTPTPVSKQPELLQEG